MTAKEHPIVLFDGVCNLCSATVRFIAERDPERRFRFGAIQSEAGRQLMLAHGLPGDELESVILIEDGRAYRKSTAAVHIARHLKGEWPVLYALIIVPRGLRDALYDFIGRRRYRWFGRTEACWVPGRPIADLFIEEPPEARVPTGQGREEN